MRLPYLVVSRYWGSHSSQGLGAGKSLSCSGFAKFLFDSVHQGSCAYISTTIYFFEVQVGGSKVSMQFSTLFQEELA
jgi:hypothetical protein